MRDSVARWQYDGTLKWHNPSPSNAATSTQRATGEVRRQTLRKMAWLKYQNRTKEGYYISIGNATGFDLTIELLKANVPAKSRNYNPDKKEWWISDDYEGILEELFHNFTPRNYQAYTATTRTTPSYAKAYQTTVPRTRSLSGKGDTHYRKHQSNQGGWLVVAVIVVVVSWTLFSANNYNASITSSAASTRVVRNSVQRTTVLNAISTTQSTKTPRPTTPPIQPTTVRDSNIREGPSPDFPIVRTVTSGTSLALIGYNDDRGVVWYKLSDGSWIWGDLVRNAPDVPYVSAPSLIVSQPPTPAQQPACDCSGNLYNCANFSTHNQAQACMNYCVSQGRGDVHWLDGDSDGSACESLP